MRATIFMLSGLLPACLVAQSPVSVQLVPWADAFLFPTDVTHCGDDRIFVVQQNGLVEIVVDSATILPTPFLDLQTTVVFNAEQGLLSLAFDPDYTTNGFFYVHYVRDNALGHHSVISRFSVSADPDVADPNSEVVLYTWPQTTVAHKGGDLTFAPDGTLYITLGDGSMGGDPDNNAQDLSNPLGDILRIRPEADSTYSIPPDNPYAQATGDTLPEIWASGLRNPFRIAFDTVAGDLWIGDVGQSWWEELNRWSYTDHTGPNFGWRCYEGPVVYNNSLCDTAGTYVQAEAVHANILNGGDFCAVNLGAVYHGNQFPRLQGRLLYTDYCSGQIMSLLPDGLGGWINEQLLATGPFGLVGIHTDHNGELWAINNYQHTLYRLIDPCPVPPTITVIGDSLSTDAGISHAWYLDGVLLPDDTLAVIVPQASGGYSVLVEYGNGCVLASDTVQFSPMSVGEGSGGDQPLLNIRPNPATNACALTWDGARWHSLTVEAVDAMGRTVRRWEVRGGRAELELEGLIPGCFGLRAITADGLTSRSLLVVQ